MTKLGKDLIAAIKDGKKNGLVTLLPSPNIHKLRKKLKLTQVKFAEVYKINEETIKKWEQNKRSPDSISRAYLKCIEKDPETIKRLVNS